MVKLLYPEAMIQHGGVLMMASMVLVAGLAAVEAGKEVLTNQWYVQLHDAHGLDGARHVAKRNGFSVISSVRT